MKRNYLSIRAALFALGVASALALPSISSAGQFVLNGAVTCTTLDGGANMDPQGNLNVTCTTTTTQPTTAPVCTISVNPATPIQAGQSAAISASCIPAATSYTWTSSAGAPTMVGSFQSLTFGTAGTYTYQVFGTNTIGPGQLSPVATVTVTPPGPPPVGGCTTTAVDGVVQPIYYQVSPFINKNSYISYQLPIYTSSGSMIEFTSVQSTSTQLSLPTQFSISTCPGKFDVAPACTVFGNADSMRMLATTGSSPLLGAPCTLTSGQQYYFNVRNVKPDLTPSCNVTSCSLVLTFRGS
jgi:hypothetical protein